MSLPPLLVLADGRRPRARKPFIVRPKEVVLHMATAELLRRFAWPDWKWSHFPSGELRDIRTACKLRAMGVQKGWPDFILFNPGGKLHALELKRLGETLTDDQKAFQSWCVDRGVPHAVAWTVDEAIAALDGWGVLRVKIGGAR